MRQIYKTSKQENRYIDGYDPSKRADFMKAEINNNGHAKVKTAEKKPGEDWHVDVETSRRRQ